MPAYDFRLRFNFPEAYRISSDVDELELFASPSGDRIRLRSAVTGTPIKDHPWAAVFGGPYASEDQARSAADQSKRALLYWAIEQRLGIDFGDGKQRSIVTNAGLAMLQEQHGCPFRNDLHGIDIYEHIDNLRFISVNANDKLGENPLNLIQTFHLEYLKGRQLSEKQILASEIYASSFFDTSARSRFITLVTAIEALLEPLKRSDEVQTVVAEFEAKTRQSTMDEPSKNSIIGSLQWVRYESIGQSGRALAHRLLPNELFEGQSSADFFTRCYELRSQTVHRGVITDKSVDMWQLANTMEAFVANLMIASLNDAQQDAPADTLNSAVNRNA